MRTLLLYPPITDPTSGYHSLCYLETYARQEGFHEIDILDTNIEAFLYTMQEEQLQKIKTHIENRTRELEAQAQLDGSEQLELYYLWKASAFAFDQLPEAIRTLRDEHAFYEYERYRPSAELISNWLNVLSLFGYSGQFNGFTLPVRSQFNLMSSQDMSDHEVTGRIMAPFAPYMTEQLLPQISSGQYKVVGINVTYCAQLPFALHIGRMIRAHFPDMVILYGGTEVADVWKYLSRKERYFDIFDAADACVVGEGEKAFTELLRRVEAQLPFEPMSNTLFHPKYGHNILEPVIEYHGIADLPTPDYSKLPWDKYLSPHSYVYYSPSRGCYWNRCTFCDYGLNFESPTSPWRQSPLEKIVEDLKAIAPQHKYVYFSVDVLAPALLLHLAERLLEEKIDIRWGAEIRLEQYWSPERCAMLKASGCTDISVGFESGNQRILDLIDKGTQVPRIKETIFNFSQANIGVQMMGFTGFPTETLQEALDSVQFLKANRSSWTFGGLGSFTLTPGSIVAKNPAQFGLRNVQPYQNEDIVRDLYFEDPVKDEISAEEQTALHNAKLDLQISHFYRPWFGGIDTGHTMFYHDKYGIEVVNQLHAYEKIDHADTDWQLNGCVIPTLQHYAVDDLCLEQTLRKWHEQANQQMIGLTSPEIRRLLSQHIVTRSDAKTPKRYFIRTDGSIFPFPDAMLDFLDSFAGGQSLQQFLSQLPEEHRNVHEQLFEHSIKHHFLRPQGVADVLVHSDTEQTSLI